MEKLKPCPFCGGAGKISFKDYRFVGQNAKGDKKIVYRLQVICNKCRSRGKPIFTDPLINPHPYVSMWGNTYSKESDVCKQQTELFQPYANEAIEAWNRRAKDDT